jgi:hypothetical protein
MVPACPHAAGSQATRTVRGRMTESAMLHDAELDAEIDALGRLTSAVVDLLAHLRTTDDPAKRAVLGAEFAARVDDLQADLRHRHGLSERAAVGVVARALAHVGELGRSASERHGLHRAVSIEAPRDRFEQVEDERAIVGTGRIQGAPQLRQGAG